MDSRSEQSSLSGEEEEDGEGKDELSVEVAAYCELCLQLVLHLEHTCKCVYSQRMDRKLGQL